MIEQIQVLENILKYLKDQKIDYILTGSLAMTFYAEPRMTRDIDIVLSIENLSPKSFTQFFQSDFYIDIDSIQMAIHYRKMFNILHNATGLKIDFIIQKENEFEKQKFKNKKMIKIKETDCFIISKEDLIIQKVLWSRESFSEMQFRDVRNLTRLDYNKLYVEEWIKKLNLEETWNKIYV